MIVSDLGELGLEERLTRLENMDRATLADARLECYRAPPPPKTSKQLMIKAIAYRWQENAIGGLSANARRALHKIACGRSGDSMRSLAPIASIKPGTRFMRE